MNRRGRPKLKLVVEESIAVEVRRLFRSTKNVKDKERLQAILLAMGGQHTYKEIAAVVGRASSHIQTWVKCFEDGGIDGLLARGKAPGRASDLQKASIQKAIVDGLREGRWQTAAQLAAWLEKEHGIRRALSTMYYWLGKLGGALKVPRPLHIKKDVERSADFKVHLYEKLQTLGIGQGRKVRVWVVDETRYGLHSLQRRCWGLRGTRVVKLAQQKYEWGYLYGALDVVQGSVQFCFLPSVSLELTKTFLEQIAASDPEAEHIIIWDQAGFHYRAGDPRVPGRIHLLTLPPYSPELNPIEKLWDCIKDSITNRVYRSLGQIEQRLTEALRPYWESVALVKRLVGKGWLHTQANAT